MKFCLHFGRTLIGRSVLFLSPATGSFCLDVLYSINVVSALCVCSGSDSAPKWGLFMSVFLLSQVFHKHLEWRPDLLLEEAHVCNQETPGGAGITGELSKYYVLEKWYFEALGWQALVRLQHFISAEARHRSLLQRSRGVNTNVFPFNILITVRCSTELTRQRTRTKKNA